MSEVSSINRKQTNAFVWPASPEDPVFGTDKDRSRHAVDFLQHLRTWNRVGWVKELKKKLGSAGEVTLVSGFVKNDFTHWSLILSNKGFRFRTEEFKNSMEGMKLHSVRDVRVGKDLAKLLALLLVEPSLEDLSRTLQRNAKDRFINASALPINSSHSQIEELVKPTMIDTSKLYNPDARLPVVPFEQHSPTNRFVATIDPSFVLESQEITRRNRLIFTYSFEDKSEPKAAWGPLSLTIKGDQSRIGEIDRSLVRKISSLVTSVKQPHLEELKSTGSGILFPNAIQIVSFQEYADALPLEVILEIARDNKDNNKEFVFSFPELDIFVAAGAISIKPSAEKEVQLTDACSTEEFRRVILESAFPSWTRNLYRERVYADLPSSDLLKKIEDVVKAREDVRFVRRESSVSEGIREFTIQFVGSDSVFLSTPKLNWLSLIAQNLPIPSELSLEGYIALGSTPDKQAKSILAILQLVADDDWSVESVPPHSISGVRTLDVTLQFRPIQSDRPFRLSNFGAVEYDNTKSSIFSRFDESYSYSVSYDSGTHVELHRGIQNLVQSLTKQYPQAAEVANLESKLKAKLFMAAEELMENLTSTAAEMFQGGQTSLPMGSIRDFIMLGFGASFTLRPVWNADDYDFDIYFVDYRFGDKHKIKPNTSAFDVAASVVSSHVWPEPKPLTESV